MGSGKNGEVTIKGSLPGICIKEPVMISLKLRYYFLVIIGRYCLQTSTNEHVKKGAKFFLTLF